MNEHQIKWNVFVFWCEKITITERWRKIQRNYTWSITASDCVWLHNALSGSWSLPFASSGADCCSWPFQCCQLYPFRFGLTLRRAQIHLTTRWVRLSLWRAQLSWSHFNQATVAGICLLSFRQTCSCGRFSGSVFCNSSLVAVHCFGCIQMKRIRIQKAF